MKNFKDLYLILKMLSEWEIRFMTLKINYSFLNLRTTHQLSMISDNLKNEVNLSRILTHIDKFYQLIIEIKKFLRICIWFLCSSFVVLINQTVLFSKANSEKNLEKYSLKFNLLMNINLIHKEKKLKK